MFRHLGRIYIQQQYSSSKVRVAEESGIKQCRGGVPGIIIVIWRSFSVYDILRITYTSCMIHDVPGTEYEVLLRKYDVLYEVYSRYQNIIKVDYRYSLPVALLFEVCKYGFRKMRIQTKSIGLNSPNSDLLLVCVNTPL